MVCALQSDCGATPSSSACPLLIYKNMYLLINLSEKDNIQLALFNESEFNESSYSGQNRELLVCIDDLLNKQNLNKKNIKGIISVVGAGGFTSTRIASVVGNTLAYTLHIPILAIKENQIKSPYGRSPAGRKIQKLIPKLLEQPVGQYISPTYSGEPNITTPKNK